MTTEITGYIADDGNCEVEYPECTAEEAAEEYVSSGDWGERAKTDWINVHTWPIGMTKQEAEEAGLWETHQIELDPDEPACSHSDGHDWQSPIELIKNIKENPGVFGHGGGVIIHEVCVRCGCRRITDTWAQDSATGEQGLESVEYEATS